MHRVLILMVSLGVLSGCSARVTNDSGRWTHAKKPISSFEEDSAKCAYDVDKWPGPRLLSTRLGAIEACLKTEGWQLNQPK